jgi:predicted phosphoribosyltransferase
MREACFECCRKHIAQAHILALEAKLGYPLHKYLAIGHLAEAEDEIIEKDESLAMYIRAKRKEYTEVDTPIPTLELLQLVLDSEQVYNSRVPDQDQRDQDSL